MLRGLKESLQIKTFGNSMLPYFIDGDVLTLKKITFNRLNVNDIITFYKYKKLITHRIIYLTPQYVITKGDNNPFSDGKIYPKQIIGKVRKVIRSGVEFDPDYLYLLQSSTYFQEIKKVKRVFEKTGIDFVFLKGLPIHLYYEKSYPKKIYADCDILVAKKKFQSALKRCERLGYKPFDNSLSSFHKILRDKQTQISLYKKVNNFFIVFDFHSEAIFTVTQLGRLDKLYSSELIDKINDDFLREKMSIKIHGENYPLLSMENQIIFLTHHFYRDNYHGIQKLAFLSLVINKYMRQKNILPLFQKISQYQLTNLLYPCFLYLRKYFGIYFSSKYMKLISPTKDVKHYIVREILTDNIFDDVDRITAGKKRFRNLFYLSSTQKIAKIFVFTEPKVIYSILWVMTKQITSKAKKVFRSNNFYRFKFISSK